MSEVCLTHASGTAEREAVLVLLDRRPARSRITLGADGAAAFITELRARSVTPHVAVYAVTQRVRKRIEEVFGWMKASAGLRQTRFRGVDRVGWSVSLAATAYNLIRPPRLLEAPT